MTINIYITGVGGQGIGMLSEALIRAADHAGLMVKGVDTHGLAQRGGIVVSHLRIGGNVHSPLIPEGQADIAVALERHEALRALNGSLKDSGTLVWYDTVWQPLEVRVGAAPEVAAETIAQECSRRKVRNERVRVGDLPDTRMQNVALLATICKRDLIPGVKREHYEAAMGDLMDGKMLEKNRELFVKLTGTGR